MEIIAQALSESIKELISLFKIIDNNTNLDEPIDKIHQYFEYDECFVGFKEFLAASINSSIDNNAIMIFSLSSGMAVAEGVENTGILITIELKDTEITHTLFLEISGDKIIAIGEVKNTEAV